MKKVNSLPAILILSALLPTLTRGYTLEGLPGTLFSPSAQPLGHLGLAITAGAYGHQDASMVRHNLFLLQETGGALDSNQVQDLQSAMVRISLAVGIGRFVDVGVSVPFAGDFISDTQAKELTGTGLGDPLFSLKGSYTLAGDHLFDAALLTGFTLPSKTTKGFLPKQGSYMRDDSLPSPPRFFSSTGAGWSARMLLTLDLSRIEEVPPPFRASVGGGFANSGMPGTSNRFLLGGGLEWLAMPNLIFSVAAQTETRMSALKQFADIGKEYGYYAAGFAAHGDDGIFFAVNFQKSMPSERPFREYNIPVPLGTYKYEARSQPRLALVANLGWSGSFVAADNDNDGLPDKEDSCPNEKEDFDNFQDMDGCPEHDNDADSISDAMDKCPIEQEDLDGYQDEDGCPETDNDKDGLADGLDKCANDAEDMDGYEDYDGCPELDNDKDGVPDAQDKCPGIIEDADTFEDTDGCPEPDNDQDKIPDLNDKCPNEAESYNGFEDGDGCPDLSRSLLNAVPLDRRTVLTQVHFLGNTAELLPESFAFLDTLAERIRGIAGLMVEVRGYWDGAGAELDGFRSSEARANSVRKYLVGKGVESNQILARGMGARDPIDNNKSAMGRQRNRRVELHRMN